MRVGRAARWIRRPPARRARTGRRGAKGVGSSVSGVQAGAQRTSTEPHAAERLQGWWSCGSAVARRMERRGRARDALLRWLRCARGRCTRCRTPRRRRPCPRASAGEARRRRSARVLRRKGQTRETHRRDQGEVLGRRAREREAAGHLRRHVCGLERLPVVRRDVDVERAGTCADGSRRDAVSERACWRERAVEGCTVLVDWRRRPRSRTSAKEGQPGGEVVPRRTLVDRHGDLAVSANGRERTDRLSRGDLRGAREAVSAYPTQRRLERLSAHRRRDVDGCGRPERGSARSAARISGEVSRKGTHGRRRWSCRTPGPGRG